MLPVSRTAFLLLVLALGGCEGPMGPEGPVGPGGPGTRLVFISPLTGAGGAVAVLPPEAGRTANDPPAMSCYVGMGDGIWLAVTDGFSATSTYCALVFSGTNFQAHMRQGPPGLGWQAAFVVVY